MDKEKRNQVIIVSIIIILLLGVMIFSIYSFIESNEEKANNDVNVKLKQIYSSDYLLSVVDDNYFIGSYEEGRIDVIINNEGKEVYNSVEGIYYDNIFKMEDGNYLIYNNLNNILNIFVFDGVDVKSYYTIDDVSYVKPILYEDKDDDEYIVGFTSIVDDSLYLYNLDNSGIAVINNVTLIGDKIENDIYYTYSNQYLAVKASDGMMGIIDFNGNVIIDYEYKSIINTKNDVFIALNKKGKYGIIDKNSDVLLKFNYNAIEENDGYYLIVNNKNKMALFDDAYNNLTGFKMDYNDLITFDSRGINSIKLYNVGKYVVVLNNYLEGKNGTEYEFHDMYLINDNEIVKTIEQIGFGSDDVLYTYDNNYNIVIYNNSFSVLTEFKIENIKKVFGIEYLTEEIVEVCYLNNADEVSYIYYNILEDAITSYDLGRIVLSKSLYSGYIIDNEDEQVFTLYDSNLNVISSVSGKYIIINNEYVITDNSIFKIVVE